MIDVAGMSSGAATTEVGRSQPDGIVAFADSQLLTTSVIAAGLGLRFNTPAVTKLFVNKYAQRAAFQAAGLIVPKFVSIPADSSAAQIVEVAAAFDFPGVLKPVGGSGSRDTYHVECADRLLQLLTPERGDREVPREDFVLEEYLPDTEVVVDRVLGDYVSVESVVIGGRARHLAVTGKFALEEPYRETGNFMPSLLSHDEQAPVIALVEQVVAALGVEYGCLHTEIKMTPAGLRIIESNARVAGGGIEDLFVMSYGQSLLQMAVMAALGTELPETVELESATVAYQLFFQPPVSARRLVRIVGLDDVSALPGVAQVSFNRREGGEVDWRQGSEGYVGWIRGSVPDHDALRSMRAQIRGHLVVEYS
ncbi:MAG: ATP-grasp domain-containing protein [Acidimicrobiia bacterium]